MTERVVLSVIADGVRRVVFACPGCGFDHALPIEPRQTPGPAWGWNGSHEHPTLTPSILMRTENRAGPVVCHSFVREGRIEFLGDCTHALADQTVDLPEVSDELRDMWGE
jgi:hypothetical protein